MKPTANIGEDVLILPTMAMNIQVSRAVLEAIRASYGKMVLPPILYQDLEGNPHNIKEIDDTVLKHICEYVIEESRMDYYVFRFAYDARDILSLWKQNQIRSYHGSSVSERDNASGEFRILGHADWNYSSKHLFRMINYGSGSQNIIFPVYRMRLEFDKASTNPAFTKNNNLYSFDGAQFVVFKNNKDAADTARTKEQNTNERKAGAITKGGAVSYIYTDSTGRGFFKNFGYGADNTDYAIVDIDNYYVIEYRSPNGYALNNNYYGFTDSGEVDDNGLPIYRISSSLKAANGKPAFPNEPRLELRIQKRSADTSISNGNKCYSLENAEYGIYDSKADAENNTNLRGVIVTDENGKGVYANSQKATSSMLLLHRRIKKKS